MGLTVISPTDYPHLFAETIWPWGPTRARFELFINAVPAEDKIANVNIVGYNANSWLLLQLADGSWDIPGGTLEHGETYLDTVRRELIEEAGARLKSFELFGGWFCFSHARQPYRPHLPHPEYYRIVGTGEVELVGTPTNPIDGEQVARAEFVSLESALENLSHSNRQDLAELYMLASKWKK